MAKKGLFAGVLAAAVFAVVFTLGFAGCDFIHDFVFGEEEEDPPSPGGGGQPPLTIEEIPGYLDDADGGDEAFDPVFLPVTNGAGWDAILQAIANAEKYVALDVSACNFGAEFDPGTGETGKNLITALVLPGTAASIKAGNVSAPTFKYFTFLTSVSGAAVQTVGDYAFYGCIALDTVSLPAATSIGDCAFLGCTALDTVSLPAATSIGGYAFYDCATLDTVSLPAATSIGVFAFCYCASLDTVSLPAATSIGGYAFSYCAALATVSLPKTPPKLGIKLLDNKTGDFTVKVPSSATGYGSSPTDTTTVCWGNGFRGGGWDGSKLISTSNINSNITLTIESE